MITFEQLKKLAESCVLQGGEPEIWLSFCDKKNDYMIIAFEDRCSFQHCGSYDGSDEYYYETLDELYETETVDGILLKRDWDKITDIWSDDIEELE